MTPDASRRGFTPTFPGGTALLVYVAAALALCWPMLTGQFAVTTQSDQYSAGFAYRAFEAAFFRAHGSVPAWNPFLFGGMPYVGSSPHDLFYVTAWLRWLLPTDTAMNLGFFTHLVFAGLAMYALLRRLKVQWTAALIGGLSYELTGIVASMISPGHDGKLYVSAWAPLFFLALIVIFREHRRWGYGLIALTVGAGLLAAHVQLVYYLLVTGGLFTLWLAYRDLERDPRVTPGVAVIATFGAVLLGVAISGLQTLPFLEYIPFSPRGEGGPSGGWEYATAYAMPVEELATTFLPQFNGILDHYWGQNFFKLHTEFIGSVTLVLAMIGVTDSARGRIRWPWLVVLVLALLIAFGGHTPFYHLWYAVMPMMKKVRAPGMAFFLVALSVAVYAGFGVDRILRSASPRPLVLAGFGVFALIGLLGQLGVLQPLAEALAPEQTQAAVVANAEFLRAGGLRLLIASLVGGGIVLAIVMGRVEAGWAALGLTLAVAADLWSVDRNFVRFSPSASVLYADDAITRRLKATEPPYRVLDFWLPQGGGPLTYQHSLLMGYGISQVFGYHGQELHLYDDLWGGKGAYANQGKTGLWDLWSVRYILFPEARPFPGYHQVAGPVQTAQGNPAFLFERDSLAPYARVVAAAAKVPDDQAVATITDPRFPVRDLVILPDTASVEVPAIQGGQLPALTPVSASVVQWEPGKMQIKLTGTDTRPLWLVVSENWFPDWRALVDGERVPIQRGNHTMIAVPLKPGAKDVDLVFRSESYRKGRWITGGALLLTLLIFMTSGIGGAPRTRPA